jgi:hypothetical protein
MGKKEIIKIVVASSLGTLLVAGIVFGGGYFLYSKYISSLLTKYKIEQKSKTIINEIGKVVMLPEDETPQVATILDAEQLKKNDSFFASAKNGDATIFYEKSGIIILFNLETHKLMNMGVMATNSASSGTPTNNLKFNN